MPHDFKAGDLVMVVRNKPCGCKCTVLGYIDTVRCIYSATPETLCDECFWREPSTNYIKLTHGKLFHHSQLRRIDPLQEPEERKEELYA